MDFPFIDSKPVDPLVTMSLEIPYSVAIKIMKEVIEIYEKKNAER